MINVGICGDSWMSIVDSDEYRNTHFSELLAANYNLNCKHYARQGSSNGGICLQIEQAIEDKCNLILFCTTTYNRIEYSMEKSLIYTDDDTRGYLEEVKLFNAAKPCIEVNQKILAGAQQDFKIGHNVFTYLLTQKDPWMQLNKECGKEQDEDELEMRWKALKYYFSYLYHPAWKKKIDQWCMYAVLHKLYESNIPYVFVYDFLKMPDISWLQSPVIGEPYTLQDHTIVKVDPGYHTTMEQQVEIYKILETHLKSKGFLL